MNGAGTLATMKPPLAASRHSDPWAAVISSLKEDATHEPCNLNEVEIDPLVRRAGRNCADNARRPAAADRAHVQPAPPKSANVTFVERFTAKSVSITWRDSTAANYCEQLWIRRIARSQGVCALTGVNIVRGDAIYGPAGRTSVRPANSAQMVLAEALEGLESRD